MGQSFSTDATRIAPESVRSRYAITLFSQFVQLFMSGITAVIVPRVLGPAVYGNYSFLLNTASTLRGFLDLGSQQAFFTFSSQDRQSGPLTKIYLIFMVTQIGLIFGFIALAAATGTTGWLWPGQKLDQIAWITMLEWVVCLGVSLRQLGDSKALTFRPQVISTVVSLFSLAGLLLLVAFGKLNLYTFVQLNLISGVALCGVLGYWLLHRYSTLCWTGGLLGRIGGILRRCCRYASPLIFLSFYTPLVAYLSTYLVQAWYGPAEQGYFALALRWSALVMVFTSSAVNILWREISASMAAGDRGRASYIYLRFNRLLFFLALMLCFWLSFSSRAAVLVLSGDQYRAAIPVLMIMAFYPLAQTYVQINTAVLKGAECTAQFRNLNILLSIPDLALTYFLLAPPTAVLPGLGMGAIGVAVRMGGYYLVSVQAYELASFRLLGLSYRRSLREKLVVFLIIGGCAALILATLNTVAQSKWGLGTAPSFVLSSILYLFLVGSALIARPQLAGLTRAEIKSGIHSLARRAMAFWS